MIQKPRGEQRFASITYSLLSRWTGLTLQTVRSYAARGHFRPHDLEGTLAWVNARRAMRGWAPIGAPASPYPVDPDNGGPVSAHSGLEPVSQVMAGSASPAGPVRASAPASSHPASCRCSQCYQQRKARRQ